MEGSGILTCELELFILKFAPSFALLHKPSHGLWPKAVYVIWTQLSYYHLILKHFPGDRGDFTFIFQAGSWNREWPGTYPRSWSLLGRAGVELRVEDVGMQRMLCPEPPSRQDVAGERGREAAPSPSPEVSALHG